MRNELQEYSADIAKAYDYLLARVREMKAAGLDPDDFRQAMQAATGTTGSMCGAAKKRVLRDVVIEALQKAKADGLDVTPTVAMHVCERVIGRGIDNRQTLDFFATPGRTAADKSRLTAVELGELENDLRNRLEELSMRMLEIKEGHRQAYKAALAE